ncbi:unnamed protein product [Peronospora belbahrii]|uniref:Heat shock protein 70 n=1 Tax=Peronospora belbahrii TaxID=622444 RepID=A0ABN8CRD6_9STRA|nr:unnamed protein product [Peronospora belbahrii]
MYASYDVVPSAQGNVTVQVVRGNKKVNVQLEEISACILTELKSSAEGYFDGQVSFDNVVITVPAYFSDSQRKATLTSAYMAGFKAVRLLNEPTAAAMAYGLFLSGKKLVTVFDFGGGTLDVSLLSIEDGLFEVLGIGGDTNLGGDDIDNMLVDHLLEVLYKHHNVTRAQVGDGEMVRLMREVLHSLSCDASLKRLCDPIWKKCLRIVSSVLKEAEVKNADIDEVILVGGSTQIPILRAMILEAFDGKLTKVHVSSGALHCPSMLTEVVCEGAAIQAAILSGVDKRVFHDVLMMDVLPLSIGLETADGDMR